METQRGKNVRSETKSCENATTFGAGESKTAAVTNSKRKLLYIWYDEPVKCNMIYKHVLTIVEKLFFSVLLKLSCVVHLTFTPPPPTWFDGLLPTCCCCSCCCLIDLLMHLLSFDKVSSFWFRLCEFRLFSTLLRELKYSLLIITVQSLWGRVNLKCLVHCWEN